MPTKRLSPADRMAVMLLLALGVTVFALLLRGKMPGPTGAGAVARRGELSCALAVSAGSGDVVRFDLRVTNVGGEDARLEFGSGQKYDFVVSQGGRVVWSWSEGKSFSAALEHLIIPAGESVVFSETWDVPGAVSRGGATCTVVGFFLGRARPSEPAIRVGPVEFSVAR